MSWVSAPKVSQDGAFASPSGIQGENHITRIRILSSNRVFPEEKPTSPQTVPLSILDSTCADSGQPNTVLFFDPPRAVLKRPDHLQASLSKTLNTYPQLCGQTHFSEYHYSIYKPEQGHTQRFGRLFLTFGKDSDPGVELRIVECPFPLSGFIPNPAQRHRDGYWDPSSLPSADFVSPTPIALCEIYGDTTGVPCMSIQITAFSCGSIAIGVRSNHAMTDATSLAQFIHDWAAVSKAMASNLPIPTLSPVFNPQLLDQLAAGDIDAKEPDAELIRKSASLGRHKFDWYAFDDGRPDEIAGLFGETKIPDAVDPKSIYPIMTKMPWETWDMTAPALNTILHFSASEIHALWKEANIAGVQSFVSQQDALMAHIWKLINRARKITDDEDVHLNFAIGFRKRLALPDSFMGSPIVLSYIAMKGTDVDEKPLSEVSLRIRSEIAKFDTDHIKALLHERAFEGNPRRFFQGFFGRRHTTITSWVHTRLHKVDFGMMSNLRFVDTPFPPFDGYVIVREAVPSKSVVMGQNGKEHWTDAGVDAQVGLEAEAMKRLLKDPLRTKYSSGIAGQDTN